MPEQIMYGPGSKITAITALRRAHGCRAGHLDRHRQRDAAHPGGPGAALRSEIGAAGSLGYPA